MKKLPIAGISGGKDSTSLYCLMVEEFGMDFLPIFSDTTHEHPVTVNYVKNLHIMAGGPPVIIVKSDFTKKLARKGIEPTESNFTNMALWKGRFPSTKAQFCTEWLKLWPQLEYLEENYPHHEWEIFTGIRAGESLSRSRRKPFEWNTYFDCEAVNPLLYETEEGIFQFLASKNVPPNPLYALGYGRVGCFPCIHANKGELSILPDWAWDRLQDYENTVGRTWFPPGVVPGMAGLTTIENVRQWCKTSYGGRQFDLFKGIDTADAPSCMSTWGICE